MLLNESTSATVAPRTGPAAGWRLFLRTAIARAYPRVIGQQREKSWIFFETFLPFLATTAYVYIYRAIQAPEEYVGFVIIGGAMTAFWFNVMWRMSTTLYWDKENGNLPLYMISPAPLMAILLGMAIGGLLATCIRAFVIIALGIWVFSVPLSIVSLPLLCAVFLITMAALYGLGMLLASLFLLYGRNAWQITNFLQEPIYLLSGFYFPVKNLGFGTALVASLLPLTLGLDAIRQLVFSSGPSFGFLSVPVEVALLVLQALVFIAAAKYWLSRLEALAIEQGALLERRR